MVESTGVAEIISAVLVAGGALFMLVAAVGLLRLPDFFMRTHAVTKAGTLGVGLIFLSAAVFFGDWAVTMRALLAVAFVLLTAPVSSHMIGRAGYLARVPLWEGTLLDELEDEYRLDESADEDAYVHAQPDGRRRAGKHEPKQ